MPQKLSSKFPQTKSSGTRQSKPTIKRQKLHNDDSPTIQTPEKITSARPAQTFGEEEELCLKRFDLTSRFGETLASSCCRFKSGHDEDLYALGLGHLPKAFLMRFAAWQ